MPGLNDGSGRLRPALRSVCLLSASLATWATSHAGTISDNSLYLKSGDGLRGYSGMWTQLDAETDFGCSLRKFAELTALSRCTTNSGGVTAENLFANSAIVGLLTNAVPGFTGAADVYLAKAGPKPLAEKLSESSQHGHASNHNHNGTSQRSLTKLLRWIERHPDKSLEMVLRTANGSFTALLTPGDFVALADFTDTCSITGYLLPATTDPAVFDTLPRLIGCDPSNPPAPTGDESNPPVGGDDTPAAHAPEPASATLLAIGAAVTWCTRRRRAPTLSAA